MVICGDRWITHDCPKIADNPTRSDAALFQTLIADGDAPFLAPFQPTSHRSPVLARNSPRYYSRLSTEKRAISGDRRITAAYLKLRKNADNLPRSEEALVRTLTTASNAPFLESLQSSRRWPVLARNWANYYSRLSTEEGAFSETDGLPAIFLKLRKNADSREIFISHGGILTLFYYCLIIYLSIYYLVTVAS